MTIINGQKLLAAAPLSPMIATKERAHGTWHPNDYTALHERLIGSTGDTQDGALFPSGWTPEMDHPAETKEG